MASHQVSGVWSLAAHFARNWCVSGGKVSCNWGLQLRPTLSKPQPAAGTSNMLVFSLHMAPQTQAQRNKLRTLPAYDS